MNRNQGQTFNISKLTAIQLSELCTIWGEFNKILSLDTIKPVIVFTSQGKKLQTVL